ncbi:aspartyl/asparaginyl beta-hydroxylase domain-containing protein [Nocardia sp. alder85J]|uniref:aspartyl/asparaginyl beta-hydroxylase domain-containing protein n=1 Tax=Nocardia sp. alder85J TaxID=2862949 RepID=UPI001CD27F93|nr:aspartyl/asparaginyl beta-hydroxylase domain-containing protein [Nocardia sp. alder85J]MCX4094316.1 aspartyl/asparaginyl beta-hydroxylase domain-containing protein [Nocardia sp. alder85J]
MLPTADVDNRALLRQVACLRTIDDSLLERLRHEALTVPDEQLWVEEYSQYQSGGWSTLSLLNGSGSPTDVRIMDCTPVETTLLERMPVTRKLLASLGLRYMWVRLARLGPNSFLWEHRDYDELSDSARQRLHIPLMTNSSAMLVAGGVRVWLRPGRIWRLTPTHVHGACNLLGPDRYHLLLDCYSDDRLAELMANEWLDDADLVQLPPATETELQGHFQKALSLARLGYRQSAERYLLRLFYQRSMPEGLIYDLISSLYDVLGDAGAAREWSASKTTMLGLAGSGGTA